MDEITVSIDFPSKLLTQVASELGITTEELVKAAFEKGFYQIYDHQRTD